VKACKQSIAGCALLLLLSGCGSAETEANFAPVVVPTSPNAAYQTTFPELGATDVTILGGEVTDNGGVSQTPTPEAAPVVTEAVNEEITTSPETIDVEATGTTTP
jgi:hypothetical protein